MEQESLLPMFRHILQCHDTHSPDHYITRNVGMLANKSLFRSIALVISVLKAIAIAIISCLNWYVILQ